MRRTALLVAAFSLALPASAQIYQWKDESGKTVISDKPPVGYVRQQKRIESDAATAGSAGQKSLSDRDMEFRKRQKETQELTEKSKKEEASVSEKQENCGKANHQLRMLESGERIALRDDKGERYFMEDAQREQEIGRVRKFLDTNCK